MRNDKFSSCLGLIVMLLVVAVFGYILSGYVLSILWGWFVVPVFSVKSIGIAEAIGLTVIAGMFRPTQKSEKDDADRPMMAIFIEAIGTTLLTPLVVLFVGWIVKGFVP